MKDAPQIPIQRHGLPHLEVYDVTGDELNVIERECGNVGTDFQVSSLSFATACSFLTALKASPPSDTKTFVVFTVITVLGFALTLIFGVRWFWSRGALARIMQTIRSRPVGPLGSEEHVLKPAELEKLQPEEPAYGEQE
jgi:hypothetical protein